MPRWAATTRPFATSGSSSERRRRDVLVRQAVEAIAADAGLAERAGQGHDVGDFRVAAMERRVEAGHVKRRGIAGAGGAEGVEAPGLVKPVERNESFERRENAIVDGRRPEEIRAAVDDPVADGGGALAVEMSLEELSRPVDRVAVDALPARERSACRRSRPDTRRTSGWRNRR